MSSKSESSQIVIRNLYVSVKTKHILHGVNAAAHSGELLAIMGPTGSGKTTLLNAVAGRVDITSGDITLNEQSINKQLRRRLGYVLQEDVFMSRLTLYETLYFTAMIRIPESVSHKHKMERIQEIIQALDLQKCEHTVVGNFLMRGLSGGEKKRANIACELLTDPDIMLLDEPTSGLDSSTAHSLMIHLKDYATRFNKTIVSTIHQPSSQVYHMFSSLLLLMDGHTAYFGSANTALDHFERLGFQCAIHFNPADFLMGIMKQDKVSRDKISEEAKRCKNFVDLLESKSTSNGKPIHWSTNSINTSDVNVSLVGLQKSASTCQFVDVCTVDAHNLDLLKTTQRRWPTSFWTQYRMLTWRQFKQSKGHILRKYKMMESIFMALVVGVLYFQTEYSYKTFRNLMGFVFFIVTFWSFECIISAITSFPAERGVIRKERDAGAYRLSALYCAKMTSDMPLILIVPVLFYSISFWMAGFGDVVLFVIYIAVNFLHCLVAQSIGLIIGAKGLDMELNLILSQTYMLFSLLFSGFFNTFLPVWLKWAKYLSVVHYTFSVLNILSTENMPVLWCNTTSVEVFPGCTGNTTYLTKEVVLKDYGIEAPYYCYLASLGILLVVLRIMGYYVMRFNR